MHLFVSFSSDRLVLNGYKILTSYSKFAFSSALIATEFCGISDDIHSVV